jgi:glycine cleavage system H protein
MAEEKDTRVFSRRHLWARLNAKRHTAYIGITDVLSEQLSEIESIDLPEPGDEIDMDNIFMHFHLANRIIHLRAPLTGRVLEQNKEVLDNCSLLHLDPNQYWLVRMEYDSDEEVELLMDVKQYLDFVDKL